MTKGVRFWRPVEIEGPRVIGQFSPDAGGTTDQFGMVLEEGNALLDCVNAAVTTITDSGELEQLTAQWLADNTGAPFITE